jgi:ketosteroid isomerase-like protein
MSETANKQLIQEAFEAWASGTGGVFDLFAPNVTWTIVGNSTVAGSYRSREAFLDIVIRLFNARLATPLVPVLKAMPSSLRMPAHWRSSSRRILHALQPLSFPVKK